MGRTIYGISLGGWLPTTPFLSYQQDKKEASWEGQLVFQVAEAIFNTKHGLETRSLTGFILLSFTIERFLLPT